MNIFQKTLSAIRRNPLETGAILLAVTAVTMAGYAFVSTQAAGPYAYSDATTATVSGAAKLVNDTGAAGGKAIQFGAATPPPPPATNATLRDTAKKEIAMKLVSSAENSSLDWRAQYGYIEDIGDGRGYTAGIIGFCTSLNMCGDLLELVEYYTSLKPNNVLAKYIPALKKTNNATHNGLDPNFTKDWKTAAADPVFQQAQDRERDRVYFEPAVTLAISDGVPILGQFAYYDAAVVHGYEGLVSIRTRALKKAKTPAQGGNVTTYMNAFLDERVVEMKKEDAHDDVTRIETAQRKFLKENNVNLNTPLKWSVYGDPFEIK